MFDPSFFELLVICVVALLVLGPDKLPGAIKTLGLWIGRLRRSFNNIKREIEQEVGADEIRRQLRNEAIMEKFNTTKNQVTESIQSVKKEAEAVKDELNLKKELSGSNEQSAASDDNEDSDEVDPVEMLATKDPAARTIKTGKNATADTNAESGADTHQQKEAPATGAGEGSAKGSDKDIGASTTGDDKPESRKDKSGT